MDNSKNKLLAVPIISAVFFLVLFFLVSLVTGYKPYAEAASVFSVLKTVFGWLGLFAFASFVIVMFGRMSQLITSGWFIGILVGAAITVGGSAIFLFTAAGPRTTTVDGKSIRSVKQLQAFLDGGTAAIDAAENPEAQQEAEPAAPTVTGEAAQYAGLFEKKCNSCHPFKSVASKFTTKYVAQGKIDEAIEMMRIMPNSGITKKDAEQIGIYLKAAYGKGSGETPATSGDTTAAAAGTDSSAAAPADQAGGAAAVATLSPEEMKEGETLFNKKCTSCHPFKSVASTFTTKYVSKGKIADAVEMMRTMPNSGITKKDAEKITAYLKATYAK